MDFSELRTRFDDIVTAVNMYFSQLNDNEKYAWIAEASGFVVIVVGVALLF